MAGSSRGAAKRAGHKRYRRALRDCNNGSICKPWSSRTGQEASAMASNRTSRRIFSHSGIICEESNGVLKIFVDGSMASRSVNLEGIILGLSSILNMRPVVATASVTPIHVASALQRHGQTLHSLGG